MSTTPPPSAAVSDAGEADRNLLTGFLRQLSPAARARELTDDTPLLTSGILDSLAILELMSFLSSELGIEIGDDDFTPENFATVGSLLAFIRARKG